MKHRSIPCFVIVFCSLFVITIANAQEAKQPVAKPSAAQPVTTSANITTPSSKNDDDDELKQYWSARIKSAATNRVVRRGIDISRDKPGITTGFSLAHDVGLSANAGFMNVVGEVNSLQRWWIGADFDYSPLEWLTFSVGYSRDFYPTADAENAFVDFVNSLTASIAFDVDNTGVSASYLYLPGDTPAQYLSLGGFSDFAITDNVKISANWELSWVWQRIQNQRLVQFQERARRPLPPGFNRLAFRDVQGLSAAGLGVDIRYKPIKQLSLKLSPSYLFTPVVDALSYRSDQFILTFSVQYALDF